MGFPGYDECLDTFRCEGILDSVKQNLSRRPRSTEFFLSSKESLPHNNDSEEEIILPEKAVGIILSFLPVKDVFRFGFKLSTNWLQIWKSNPLVLHDVQLVPDQWKGHILERSLFKVDICANLTYVLDVHPGPMDYVCIEYANWRDGTCPLQQWINIFISKGVKELVMFGRWPRGELDTIPLDIVRCNQLTSLTLCFFKLPSLSWDDEFQLKQLRTLIIAGCKMRDLDTTLMFARCSKLQRLSLGHLTENDMSICSESLIQIRIWNCRFGTVHVFQCPKLKWIMQVMEQDAEHETGIFVTETPMVEVLAHMYLDQQMLYLDNNQIAIGMTIYPQYEALDYLSLGVRFSGNYCLDDICKLLKCFPNLSELKITRLDPEKCHFTALIKWKDLIPGIPCVENKLQVFSLSNFGLDDTEIELAESVLLNARVLREFCVLSSGESTAQAINKLEDVIKNTIPVSNCLYVMKYG